MGQPGLGQCLSLGMIRARLDAQLGDLQVDRRVAVLLVEAHGQARMLGQKVDPAAGDPRPAR